MQVLLLVNCKDIMHLNAFSHSMQLQEDTRKKGETSSSKYYIVWVYIYYKS